MVLADTSVWIDYQRGSASDLEELLVRSILFMHPWVVGELACGSISDRDAFLRRLLRMPRLRVATEDQTLLFLKMHSLHGRGIGYIDMQLLAATALNGARIWTRDKRLAQAANDLNIAYIPRP